VHAVESAKPTLGHKPGAAPSKGCLLQDKSIVGGDVLQVGALEYIPKRAVSQTKLLALFKVKASFVLSTAKAPMSDLKTSQEKLSALSADVVGTVNEALHKARPAISHMADRMNDSLHDLAQHGKEAALDAEHKLEKEARHAKALADHYIQHAPMQSVLIAAGTGAVAALAVSWFMRSRTH
jgi:ElaB/YqjD/DUF883 family membrane-anchored ribosome-binding protein